MDRTREFLALVDAAIAAGHAGGAGAKPHPALREPAPLSAAAAPVPTYESRSAFIRATREVSSDLNRTSLKLSALTKREWGAHRRARRGGVAARSRAARVASG